MDNRANRCKDCDREQGTGDMPEPGTIPTDDRCWANVARTDTRWQQMRWRSRARTEHGHRVQAALETCTKRKVDWRDLFCNRESRIVKAVAILSQPDGTGYTQCARKVKEARDVLMGGPS